MTESHLYLKEWLAYRGIKQARIVEALNVAKGQISDLATGRQPYSKKWLDLIAPILECEPKDLLSPPHARDEPPIEFKSLHIDSNASQINKGKQFLDRVDALRKTASLNQADLCEAAGLDRNYLGTFRQRVKRGTAKLPKISTLESLASALNVTVDELLGTGSEGFALFDEADQLEKALSVALPIHGLNPEQAPGIAATVHAMLEAFRVSGTDAPSERDWKLAGSLLKRRSGPQ